MSVNIKNLHIARKKYHEQERMKQNILEDD